MFNPDLVKGNFTGGEIRDSVDGEKWQHRRWTARLRFEGRTFQVAYKTGMGIEGKPTIPDVLESVFGDARAYLDAEDFGDFAANFGYDADSYKAYRIYQACESIAARLERFFGEHYAAAESHFYYRDN